MSLSRRSSKAPKGGGLLQYVNGALLALFTIVAAGLVFVVYRYHFFGFRGLNHLLAVSCVIVALLALLLIRFKKARVFTLLLLLMALLASGAGAYGLKQAISLSEKVGGNATSQAYEMSVMVLADSPLTKVSELNQLAAPQQNDGANISQLVKDIEETEGVTLSLTDVESYLTAYQKLLAGEVEAIVFNSAFETILAEQDPDYQSKVKTLYTYSIKQEVAEADSQAQDVFNIYISGIDTYGDLTSVSRSDVNIIMTVNRQTKQVLLTTTPRDAYVAIADGGQNQYDKLTHAGIYGVDASVHTLENLYEIDINYYARLNFSSFVKLVDLLGGIEVQNDQAFASAGHDFPSGKISLNSEQALIFVRERYSLEGGDNDRGRNQTKVISAIIDKLTSASALSKSQQIVDGLGDSIQTNVSLETINGLVNDQLSSGAKYRVTSQSLEGRGSTGELPSYAMPNAALYMLEVDQDSLSQMKENMKKVMEGN